MTQLFGRRLRALRKQKRLSQTRLGKEAGVHYNHIGRYERGAAYPSVPVLRRLSEILGVSMDYLIKRDAADGALPISGAAEETSGSGRSASGPSLPQPSSRLVELAAAAEALSPADQGVVTALLEAFLLKAKIADLAGG